MIKVFSITSGSKGGQPSRLTIKGPLHLGAVEFQLPQGADGYFSQIADTLSPAHHSIGQPEQVRELPLGSEDRFSRDCLQEGRSPCPAKPYPAYLLPLRFPPSVVEPVVHPPPGRLFPFPTHSNFASWMIACERSLGSPWPCGYRHRKSSIASIVRVWCAACQSASCVPGALGAYISPDGTLAWAGEDDTSIPPLAPMAPSSIARTFEYLIVKPHLFRLRSQIGHLLTQNYHSMNGM
jgi:hypothetical protein